MSEELKMADVDCSVTISQRNGKYCSVTISQRNGKLSIVASISEEAEGTVPAALAKMMIEHAQLVMNSALGENKVIEKHGTN